jgi:hypothetical protein
MWHLPTGKLKPESDRNIPLPPIRGFSPEAERRDRTFIRSAGKRPMCARSLSHRRRPSSSNRDCSIRPRHRWPGRYPVSSKNGALTRSSISSQSRDTWLLCRPLFLILSNCGEISQYSANQKNRRPYAFFRKNTPGRKCRLATKPNRFPGEASADVCPRRAKIPCQCCYFAWPSALP